LSDFFVMAEKDDLSKKATEVEVKRKIFDSSAIVNLAIHAGSRAADSISGGYGIPLTFYEIGNSIWKLHVLLRKISQVEADSLTELSLRLFDRLEIVSLGTTDAVGIERLAASHRMSFYDSSYIYAAKKNRLALITDDEKLAKNANMEKIEVLRSTSIEKLSTHSKESDG
jgi:predicted nucleic acid-binding protein